MEKTIKKLFLDTNIFVYAFDAQESNKYSISQQLISNSRSNPASDILISYQVIQEFCNVALKKSIDVGIIKKVVADLLMPLARDAKDLVSVAFYDNVVDLHTHHQVSFYDACIIQAALDLGCQTLYSEDMQDGQRFGDLTVVNPFKDSKES